MKILLVHNYYQRPGGEDWVFAQERRLLESRDHTVLTYQRRNSELVDYSPLQRVCLPKQVIWAGDTYRQILALLRREQPDIVHAHNTFVQISPSIFSACQEAGIPVVQTLHNFRLLCPAATFFRNGKVCEECRESGLWRSIGHACYQQSYGATAAVAAMLVVHRKAGTWAERVTSYIACSRFAKQKFVQGGLPAEKIRVKPNFVFPDRGEKEGPGDGAAFVGRLSPEKGLRTLLAAWRQLRAPVSLRIVGDGPLRADLERMASGLNLSQVAFMGRLSHEDTQMVIKNARLLVVPSECYENFPLTIVEAFSCGTPVVCSRLGAMQEIVSHERTGLHFTPGDPVDLARKIEWAWQHPGQITEMGKAARLDFEEKYSAEKNYAILMSVYQQAISAYH